MPDRRNLKGNRADRAPGGQDPKAATVDVDDETTVKPTLEEQDLLNPADDLAGPAEDSLSDLDED